MSAADTRPTRAQLLPRVLDCIHIVTRQLIAEPDEDTGLNADFWLSGRGFLKLGELLEEEFEITIGCDDLIDIALKARPEVKHLLDLIEEKLDA